MSSRVFPVEGLESKTKHDSIEEEFMLEEDELSDTVTGLPNQDLNTVFSQGLQEVSMADAVGVENRTKHAGGDEEVEDPEMFRKSSVSSSNPSGMNMAQLVSLKRMANAWKLHAQQQKSMSSQITLAGQGPATKNVKLSHFTRDKDDITPNRFSPEAYDRLASKFVLNRSRTINPGRGMAPIPFGPRSPPHNGKRGSGIVSSTVSTGSSVSKASKGSKTSHTSTATNNTNMESAAVPLKVASKSSHDAEESILHSDQDETKDKNRFRGGRFHSILAFEQVGGSTLETFLTQSKKSLKHGLFDVIEYGNVKKYYWDWFIVLLTFYSVIVIPFEMAFPSLWDKTPFWILFDKASDICFVVDIFLCFRAAYLDEDRFEVKEHSEIISKYLRGWFVWDFLASFPLELIGSILGVSSATSEWLKVNKIIRVTRVVKKLDDMVLTSYARIIKLFGTFCVAAHVIACFYYVLGRVQPPDVVGRRWIEVHEIADQPYYFQYISSLYWAFATLATVGYGDISANSFYERCFALITMFYGSILYATIFGTFTNLIQERDRNKAQYNERVVRIKDFTRANHLPPFIRQRLSRYHEASWQLRKVDAADVLMGVPNSAQIELMMFLYADLVMQVPIFSRCSKRFLEQVVMKFKHSIFLSGDYIIRQGDKGDDLHFVVKGCIEVYCAPHGENESASMDFDDLVAESYFVVARGPGAFIGEGALLYGKRRGASVLAVSPLVQTLYLTKEAFDECVNGSPEVLETIRGVAAFRQAESDDSSSSATGSRSLAASDAVQNKYASVQGSTTSFRHRKSQRRSQRVSRLASKLSFVYASARKKSQDTDTLKDEAGFVELDKTSPTNEPAKPQHRFSLQERRRTAFHANQHLERKSDASLLDRNRRMGCRESFSATQKESFSSKPKRPVETESTQVEEPASLVQQQELQPHANKTIDTASQKADGFEIQSVLSELRNLSLSLHDIVSAQGKRLDKLEENQQIDHTK